MVRFINNTPDRPFQKRKQAPQACDACRKKKKRCGHLSGDNRKSLNDAISEENEANNTGAVPGTPIIPRIGGPSLNVQPNLEAPSPFESGAAAADESGFRTFNGRPSQSNSGRFVGDLNPESTFLADSPETTGGYTQSDAVGVWVSRRIAGGNRSTQKTPSPQWPPISTHSTPAFQLERSLGLIPRESHCQNLKRIYLRDVHKIFPVLDLEVLDQAGTTPLQILTRQAVCLAAGTHPDARPFLKLDDNSEDSMSYPKFAERLSSAMCAVISAGLIKDRMQVIPALVILSLYTYFSEDRHQSADLAALAVSYVQTVGLHLQTPPTRGGSPADPTRLFCCAWAMDRLNAAFHGRPVMMHERDSGRDLQLCIDEQESGFRLLLETVALLDRVIALYRPTAETSAVDSIVDNLPAFEDLVEKAGALGLESRLIGTIELLYHAVVVLSCRPLRLPRSNSISANAPQRLSGLSITTIIEEFGGGISHLPFVPYAVCLSLRVAYREMRSSRVPMLRARFYRQLQADCQTLRGLGEIFRPALSMVELVERLIEEIDKISAGAAGVADGVAGEVDQGGPLRERVSGNPVPEEVENQGSSRYLPESAGPLPSDIFDASFPEGLSRIDIFDYIDPQFDLGALDTILGESVHPYFGVSTGQPGI